MTDRRHRGRLGLSVHPVDLDLAVVDRESIAPIRDPEFVGEGEGHLAAALVAPGRQRTWHVEDAEPDSVLASEDGVPAAISKSPRQGVTQGRRIPLHSCRGIDRAEELPELEVGIVGQADEFDDRHGFWLGLPTQVPVGQISVDDTVGGEVNGAAHGEVGFGGMPEAPAIVRPERVCRRIEPRVCS